MPFRKTQDEVNEIELLDHGHAGIRRRDRAARSAVRRTGLRHHVAHQLPICICGGHMEVPAHCNPISRPDGLRRMRRTVAACGGGCNCGGARSGRQHHQRRRAAARRHRLRRRQWPDTACRRCTGTGRRTARMARPHASPTADDAAAADRAGTAAAAVVARWARSPTSRLAARAGGSPEYTVPRPYSPPRQPVFVRNASSPDNPTVGERHRPSRPAGKAA